MPPHINGTPGALDHPYPPLLTGWLREHHGYHAGFFSAAVGMAFALGAFIYGRHKLSAFAFTVPNPIRPQERRRLLLGALGVLVAVGAVVAALQAVTGNLVTTVATAGLLVPVGAAVAYFVVMFRSPKVTTPERTHLRAYIPLWIGAVLFFMITEQAAGKMATFADSNTDLRLPLFGWSITAEAYQSVNPAAIVILAPLIGMLFTRRAGRFPSTIMKFVIAVLIVGLSALMLGYGFQIWPRGQHLSPWWFLALVYVIQTVAELFLTPGRAGHDDRPGTQELRLPGDGAVVAQRRHRTGRGRVRHRPDRGRLRRHLLLRPGRGHTAHGPGAVRRRPVDPTADGRRRGHRAGLGAAGPGTAGPPRVRRLSLGFVG